MLITIAMLPLQLKSADFNWEEVSFVTPRKPKKNLSIFLEKEELRKGEIFTKGEYVA